MSSKSIKNKLDNFDLNLLEVDEFTMFNELRRNYSTKRQALLYIIKNKSVSYYLQELKEVINENDNKLND
tara:strand:+ start:66 stop:275 length:210 start_codon:yes stop_codon:yes gene_type:complete